MNGVEGQFYDSVQDIRLSPDGRRSAYRALRGGRWRTVVDGQEGGLYDAIGPVRFSDDGKRWAYAAIREGKGYFIIDGNESLPFERVLLDKPPVFSPDGKRVAYSGWPDESGKPIVVVDGKKSEGFAQAMLFSPDSKRLACAVRLGGPANRIAVRLDDMIVGQYDAVLQMRFGGDSRRLAVVGVKGEGTWIACDGREIGPFVQAEPASLAFSRDGKHLACIAYRGKQRVLVMDGMESQPYDALLAPQPLAFDENGGLSIFAIRESTPPEIKQPGPADIKRILLRVEAE